MRMAAVRSRRWIRPLAALSLPGSLGGCAISGAPSYVLFGAYFPGWMFCAVLGILAAIAARAGFVASGLAGMLPFQLAVCTSIGLIAAVGVWLIWFGQ
jgi:hypothetical protein